MMGTGTTAALNKLTSSPFRSRLIIFSLLSPHHLFSSTPILPESPKTPSTSLFLSVPPVGSCRPSLSCLAIAGIAWYPRQALFLHLLSSSHPPLSPRPELIL
ncbi:hypothetical protein G6O67_000124 [Ophiocordyceps sinensis]|uniref:Uncharacterized protein n=1 Tax=Ophiocordyceps sinensis TaxID=72228 RepID=A0A8H4PYF9_9HYPO|nr:hypothetical protein G6O67_000124 [Ophiocordyceps sinensis]